MSVRTSAARYARALFDVALKEADVDQVGQALDQLVATVKEHEDLRRVLAGAAVPRAVRTGVAKALTARLQSPAPLAKLMDMLADRGRVELLPDVAAVYAERLLRHRNVEP